MDKWVTLQSNDRFPVSINSTKTDEGDICFIVESDGETFDFNDINQAIKKYTIEVLRHYDELENRKFKVPVTWRMYGTITVTAKNVNEAIEKVREYEPPADGFHFGEVEWDEGSGEKPTLLSKKIEST